MQTTLFDWAQQANLSLEDLAEMTGYSVRHLYRIRDGDWPITEAFIGRIVLRLGDWARSLFFSATSEHQTKRKRTPTSA